MFIEISLVILICIVLEILMQNFWIKKMHSLKIEQVTKLYGPAWHEKTKIGTPTMGGVVFIPTLLAVTTLAVYFFDLTQNPPYMIKTLQIISYPILAALVGLADDWLKHTRQSSDGFKSLQKLFLQIAVTAPWAMWTMRGSLTLLPNVSLPHIYAVLLVTFVGVGIQNAVNVTDGLDGLAAGCSLISFIGALAFIGLQDPIITLFSSAACGICIGFLWHNCNPASVFMGDVGAHFLAGLLLSVCLCSGAFIAIVPLGIIFGVEILSVSIQIIAIRKFHRKVFLMSPIHHHFELLGWKEPQIVARFLLIHLVGMIGGMTILFVVFNICASY
ncbi:MAG: phospho-N-acetylmuramoyl-pentapeptide-transferase [Synergistaceae bacterium]|nr:phospho-N-acetylmuramoyl-pentapeptide-transferase [Synergistaceae bacterium]